MRIFAEWRNLRLVVKGYQRYAVGLSLAYRDVLQNLEKIEQGVHDYLRNHQAIQRKSSRGDVTSIPSPTIRQLLQYELDAGIHKKLPRLEEKSSASGILWTKRQLHYQVATLSNSLEVPECYPTAKDAAWAAYRTVYDEYHGWAVKQIFSHSFGGSPPLDEIWLSIDPPKDMPKNRKQSGNSKPRHHQNKLCSQVPFDIPPERTLSDVTDKSSDDGLKEDNEFLIALDNLNHGIAEKWGDILRLFNCGGEEKRKRKDDLILSSESHFNLAELIQTNANSTIAGTASPSQTPVPTNPIEKSKQETEDFTREISPIVADLSEMIDEFNMNDPAKV
jgi:hypothetical protein